MSKETQLVLNINPIPEDDKEDLQRLTHQLRQNINELDVEKVDFIRQGDIPKGAMAGDVMTWGSLLVTLAASAAAGSGGILPTLVNAIQSWLKRHHENRSITIEMGDDKLEVSGISSDEQKRLIDSWINKQREKIEYK